MRVLDHEQMVAARGMPKRKRADWIANGGKVKKGTGHRRWKAV
jgi:hypothetical protein